MDDVGALLSVAFGQPGPTGSEAPPALVVWLQQGFYRLLRVVRRR